MITEVSRSGLREAARIHSVSWQESHRSFCTPEFIALHTPEHQEEYLRDKMDRGTRIFMLNEGRPVGIVSVTGSLIEDLYILPEYQNRGYGTLLLHYAIRQCVFNNKVTGRAAQLGGKCCLYPAISYSPSLSLKYARFSLQGIHRTYASP